MYPQEMLSIINPVNDPMIQYKQQVQVLPVLFPDEQATHVINKDFYSEIDVFGLLSQLGNHRYVHIYTHGYFDKKNPLESHLLFSNFQLSANNIYDWLDQGIKNEVLTDLITLAACESGSSKVLTGDETLGLPRAFLFAGVNTLLTSMWRVDAQFTDRFITRFYEKLAQGSSKVQALKNTIQEMRSIYPKYDHPFYWGSYILIGKPN